MKGNKSLTYRGAGVDIKEGTRLVRLIRSSVRGTYRKEVLGGIGGFAALFRADFKGLNEPVLVSAADGVGTKVNLAFTTGRHSTVGIDLVAMNVNDIVTTGAEPLFFLDYLATGRLDARMAAEVIKGIARGCKEAGCSLIGGETAEMPGMYAHGEYDLAGFAVGVVERKKIIDGSRIRPGDRVIGLASSGLHSNGFSLARKVLFEKMKYTADSRVAGLGRKTLGRILLMPTRIYVKAVLAAAKKIKILGLAHITGGGFFENIPRILPVGTRAVIEKGTWPVQPVFSVIRSGGNIDEDEMLGTFNCGIGMAAVVRPKDSAETIKAFEKSGQKAFVIGRIETRKKGPAVVFTGEKIFK